MLGWKSFTNWLAVKLKRIIRREILREAQQNLLTHNAARQALDIYEMRLETLDTRIAKRIMALEDRIAALEGAQARVRPVARIDRAHPVQHAS